jgi:hypothetical protein
MNGNELAKKENEKKTNEKKEKKLIYLRNNILDPNNIFKNIFSRMFLKPFIELFQISGDTILALVNCTDTD